MFQHITVLFSFVFAIALTHVLSCVSKLILARDRVRVSGLHALWMLNALMCDCISAASRRARPLPRGFAGHVAAALAAPFS